jgi:hypothetical protein
MILNSTKFGGNRTKDVEVGPHRQTDRLIPIYPPNYDQPYYYSSNKNVDIKFSVQDTFLE